MFWPHHISVFPTFFNNVTAGTVETGYSSYFIAHIARAGASSCPVPYLSETVPGLARSSRLAIPISGSNLDNTIATIAVAKPVGPTNARCDENRLVGAKVLVPRDKKMAFGTTVFRASLRRRSAPQVSMFACLTRGENA
jgi:hypothetical protein